MNADGSGQRLLVRVSESVGGDASLHSLTWSPDGGRLACCVIDLESPGGELFIVGVDGSGNRAVEGLPTGEAVQVGSSSGAAWTLDGRSIAVSRDVYGA